MGGLILFLDSNLRMDGVLENYLTLSVACHFLTYLYYFFAIVLQSNHQRKLISAILLLPTAIMIALYYVQYFTISTEWAVSISSWLIVNNPNTAAIVVVLALLLLVVQSAHWDFYLFPKYFPILWKFYLAIQKQDEFFINSQLKLKKSLTLASKFETMEKIAEVCSKCFKNIKNIHQSVTKMLMPEESENDDTQSFNKWLIWSSNLLKEKFLIYISTNIGHNYNSLLIAGTSCFTFYLIASYVSSAEQNKNQLIVYILIIIFLPIIYVLAYLLTWTRKLPFYNVLFQHVLLYSSIIYCIARSDEYTLFGEIILLFLSMHYNISFLHFVYYIIISFVGMCFW